MELVRALDEITAIYDATLAQLDPKRLVREALSLRHDSLIVDGVDYQLAGGRLLLLAVGKSALPMAAGAVAALGDRIAEGLVVTKRGSESGRWQLPGFAVLEASHPVPDQSSLAAGEQLLRQVRGLAHEDLVLVLVSGGGSALVEALVEGITLDDLAATTTALLRAGADIGELNAVRRRLSRIKAGGLAAAASPARVVNLIVSDVLGSPLQVIASGLSVPAEIDDAAESGPSPELSAQLPEPVRRRLATHPDRRHPDSPTNVVQSVVLADAAIAARRAVAAASRRGYETVLTGTRFSGEAREFAGFWSELARAVERGDRSMRRPACLIGTGELTVTVRGDGRGGRNTEMALAAALAIEDSTSVAIASLATDGDDADTGAAGGVVTGDSVAAARRLGLDPPALLRANDSARFLAATGGLIAPGLTGVNVNDLYIALVD